MPAWAAHQINNPRRMLMKQRNYPSVLILLLFMQSLHAEIVPRSQTLVLDCNGNWFNRLNPEVGGVGAITWTAVDVCFNSLSGRKLVSFDDTATGRKYLRIDLGSTQNTSQPGDPASFECWFDPSLDRASLKAVRHFGPGKILSIRRLNLPQPANQCLSVVLNIDTSAR